MEARLDSVQSLARVGHRASFVGFPGDVVWMPSLLTGLRRECQTCQCEAVSVKGMDWDLGC